MRFNEADSGVGRRSQDLGERTGAEKCAGEVRAHATGRGG
jgi:hypothetical protein